MFGRSVNQRGIGVCRAQYHIRRGDFRVSSSNNTILRPNGRWVSAAGRCGFALQTPVISKRRKYNGHHMLVCSSSSTSHRCTALRAAPHPSDNARVYAPSWVATRRAHVTIWLTLVLSHRLLKSIDTDLFYAGKPRWTPDVPRWCCSE